MIKSLYVYIAIVVETYDVITELLVINQRVGQGACCLSPVHFNLYIDDLIKTWKVRAAKGIQLR